MYTITSRSRFNPTNFAAAVFLFASNALAAGANSPTNGARPLTQVAADIDDALALEWNAGAIGLFPAAHGVGFITVPAQQGPGGSGGVFFGGKILGRIGYGLGAQFLPGAVTYRDKEFRDYAKLSMGLGFELWRGLSLGVAGHFFVGDDSLRSVSSVDAGITWRVAPFLAFAIASRDLNEPFLDGKRLNRVWIAGAAFRPWTHKLTIAGEARIEENTATVDWATRLRAQFIRGVDFTVGAEILPRSSSTSFNLTFGAEISVGQFGLGFGPQFGGSTDSLSSTGFTMLARLQRDRTPEFVKPIDDLVEIAFDGPIAEQPRPALFGRGPATLLDVVRLLERIERDDDVRGVLVRLERARFNFAQAQEIRARLKAIRAKGKRLFAYVSGEGNDVFLVASAAEKIFVEPSSYPHLIGLRGEFIFFKGLLDKIGVKIEAFRVGKYKSAVEPFTRTGMSDPMREAYGAFMDDVYAELVGAVAEGRGMTVDQVKAIIDRGPLSAVGAVKERLVDAVLAYEDLPKALEKEWGRKVRIVRDYAARWYRNLAWGVEPGIAVILASGNIDRGDSGDGGAFGGPTIGDRTLAKLLDAAVRDRSIRAIVIRLDTGGGSAHASDRMWRAVWAARKVKPVVVSMGRVAASGGYYLASAANAIVAEPTTLTGSIGILTLKPDVTGLRNWAGISVETLTRGKAADLYSIHRSLTDNERTLAQSLIQAGYDQFLKRIAEGRKMKVEEIDKIGQGRVWSGRRAFELKLVDKLGGLHEAITHAKSLAKMPPDRPTRIVAYPRAGLIERVLRQIRKFGVDAEIPEEVARALRGVVDRVAPRDAGPRLELPCEFELR
ncbi:MAG: signal peptide peptidase SppA [Deltaproteobacteria bacterium]|nr:signal peptide peptidase SppA [Deltaproteobacteria bacterium]